MEDSLVSASAAGLQWEEKQGSFTADAQRARRTFWDIFTRTIASGFVVSMPNVYPPLTTQ